MATLLGADEPQDFRRRIEGHPVAIPVPEGHFLPEGQHPFFFINGIAMVHRVIGGTTKLVDDTLRCRLHGVTDGQ